MKLMTKYLLVLLVVSLVPCLVMAFFSYRNSRVAIEQAALNHLTSVNTLKKSEIETWVLNNVKCIEILARNPFFKTGLKEMMVTHDMDGANRLHPHVDMCAGYLCPVVQSGDFTEIMIIRIPDGLVLVSTDKYTQGKYYENRPFFIHGMNGTYIQNVYYSTSLQQPCMTISTPLKDKNGNATAVLAGRVNLEHLSRIMEETCGLNNTEDTYLVNNFNYFVTEPRFGKGYALRKSTFTYGVTEALNRKSGAGSYTNYKGDKVIGVYTWIADRNLALVTEMHQQEVFESMEELQKTTAALCFFVVSAVIVISWFASRSLVKPLSGLVRWTDRVARGDLDVHYKNTARDEIGELAEAFGEMVGRLKTTLVSKEYLENEIVVRKKAEEKLTEVMKDLERSNKDLEQFAYVASHDLKEPLRMVWSYLELIQDSFGDVLDEKGKTYIRFAVDGAYRMENLISDLLHFSRVSTKGKKPENVSSQETFDVALKNLEMAVLESDAVVTSDPLPVVKADYTQLVQMFQNLLANAIKFSKGVPIIHVSSESKGDRVTFSVKDNGIGIDPRHWDDIFKIFHRLNNCEEYPGTGIGLALVRRIVERHGGKIWVESKKGEGSVFYFTLRAGSIESIGKGGQPCHTT